MSVLPTPVQVHHEWRLVAPWWQWPLRSDPHPGDVRHGSPAIQKYDTADMVNTFLADPQRRLAYLPDSDEVATVSGGGLGKLPTRSPTGVRKLYLGSHHRHYLVVASLRCDTTGFPHVERGAVCQAGFVVRRRSAAVPADQTAAARKALGRLVNVQRKRAAAEAQVAAARSAGIGPGLRLTALEGRLQSLQGSEAAAADELRSWAAGAGVARSLEGWIPQGVDATGAVGPVPACAGPAATVPPSVAPLAGTGAWTAVGEIPDHLDEAWYPLYPDVPDPRQPHHDAAGESIWFGVVPTGSSDVDLTGEARFDDRRVYEIRCFVRRHRPVCPREGPQCSCPITWSEPTEAYQLASHFDLEGTANRPVTVQLPDLGQLQADALRLAPAGTGGVRFQSPPNSALPFTTDNTDATAAAPNSGFQICSFSIPLITIVATFVFKLFLPIVVFVFQLWFLLALRFCIPPDVTVSGGLGAALDALGPGLQIDASVAARLDVGGDLEAAVDTALGSLVGGYQDKGANTMAGRMRAAVAGGSLDIRSFAAIVRGALGPTPVGPVPPLYAPRVRRDQVVTP